jgi:ubiquinone/menaquinone biosynthesis C-methylase UbiE
MSNGETTRFKRFYEDESAQYHKRRYQTRYGKVFKTLHHEEIRRFLGHAPASASVLEIACGTGHVSELLAELGRDFVACDLTAAMLNRARERTAGKDGTVRYVLTDAYRLPFPDDSFDFVVSTRFLHLFPIEGQRAVLSESVRVLRPGGNLLVDFDNQVSRWLYALPYLVYNLVRYQRLAPYSIYNTARQAQAMISQLGISVSEVVGIGGTHLVIPALVSSEAAIGLGRLHRSLPLRWLAEQFMVFGTKR